MSQKLSRQGGATETRSASIAIKMTLSTKENVVTTRGVATPKTHKMIHNTELTRTRWGRDFILLSRKVKK